MLTIQPKISNNYQTAFKSKETFECQPKDFADLEEDSYVSIKKDLEQQRDEFEEIADSKEFKLPKTAQKIIKGGAIVTTGLLGGMATGWGAKKSIQGFQKLAKTSPMQKCKKYIIKSKDFIVDLFKTIKTKFINSDIYQMPAKAIKKQYQKFANSKFGKPIADFFGSINKGIKKACKGIKDGINYVIAKIKGVKSETYKNATINTIGVSGGIASGVTALQEKDEAKA